MNILSIILARHGILDQDIVDKFCEFAQISPKKFWNILDKWYNRKLFEQDKDSVWHPKFRVGYGTNE